ncbi:Protein inturned [Manis javanica]|nr:Protein inturned [Manis javanica]
MAEGPRGATPRGVGTRSGQRGACGARVHGADRFVFKEFAGDTLGHAFPACFDVLALTDVMTRMQRAFECCCHPRKTASCALCEGAGPSGASADSPTLETSDASSAGLLENRPQTKLEASERLAWLP